MLSRLRTQYVSGMRDSPMLKSWEVIATEEDDGDALLGQQRGGRRAGRSAADHNHRNFQRNGQWLRHLGDPY